MTIETTLIGAGGLTFTADRAGPDGIETALFLHGFPNSRHSWGRQLEAVAEAGFRGIAPDQRGYSPDARPAGIDAYHTDRLVGDVIAIADQLEARRFHLVGHDWGGQVAWLTAMRHPERLLSLAVLSRPHPAAFARALAHDPAQAERSRHHKAFQDPAMADLLLEDNARVIRNTLAFENAEGLFGTGGAPPKRRMDEDLVAAHLSVLGERAAMDAALNWYRAAFAGRSALARADAPKVTVPTLYLWGTEDMSVGRTAAEATGGFVDAPFEFVALDGAGHFLAEEEPDMVNEALIAHLARHRAASTA